MSSTFVKVLTGSYMGLRLVREEASGALETLRFKAIKPFVTAAFAVNRSESKDQQVSRWYLAVSLSLRVLRGTG